MEENITKDKTGKGISKETKKEKMGWIIGASIFFVLSCLSFWYGLYKMFVYSNPDSYVLDAVNAYVGGDSYNYIINANYATGFFVLAIGFLICCLICFVIDRIDSLIKVTKELLEDK